MKQHRLLWFVCLLISISLACNLVRKTDVQIKSVTISPRIGSVGATFSVTVKFFEHNDSSDGVRCFETTGYDPVSVYQHGIGATETSQVFTFIYSYMPGKRSLRCETESGSSQSQWVEFTVVPVSQPPATQPPVATQPQALPGNTQGKTAGLALLVEKATSSIPGLFPHHCVPEVNIAADGTLTGSCSVTMYGNSELNTGILTGTWAADSGEINFHLKTKSVYTTSRIQGGTTTTGQTITNTNIDGTGKVVSNLLATGNADWSTDCSSTNADIVSCFSPQQASAKANGTVPWQLNLNP